MVNQIILEAKKPSIKELNQTNTRETRKLNIETNLTTDEWHEAIEVLGRHFNNRYLFIRW